MSICLLNAIFILSRMELTIFKKWTVTRTCTCEICLLMNATMMRLGNWLVTSKPLNWCCARQFLPLQRPFLKNWMLIQRSIALSDFLLLSVQINRLRLSSKSHLNKQWTQVRNTCPTGFRSLTIIVKKFCALILQKLCAAPWLEPLPMCVMLFLDVQARKLLNVNKNTVKLWPNAALRRLIFD